MGRLIAVDLGASRIRVAIFDSERKEIIFKHSEQTRLKDIPGQLVRMVGRVFKEVGEAEGIGVGAPGPLDLNRGGIKRAPNIPFDFVPIRGPLEEKFGIPVELLNDANAAALGELFFGAGRARGVRNLVYITFSTGIGGGVIESGRLLLGKDGNAGEIGCFTVDYLGKLRCGCGGRGHWQAYASGAGIPRYLKLLKDEGEVDFSGSPLSRLKSVSARELFEAARSGDKAAVEIVERLAAINAAGIGNVINAYDPELIVIGGAIALNNPDLIIGKAEPLIRDYAVNRVPEISLTSLGEDVGLYGAAAAILTRLRERR